MVSPAEMAERHGRMLAELGELGLTLACDLQGRAVAAETPQEAAELADAFHRIARSVRQSLALEAKLQREAVRDVREFTARERDARKAQLKTRVVRLIRKEVADPDVARHMVWDAPDFVEREAESEHFLDEPVEAQLARIRTALGVDEYWTLEDLAPDEDAEDAGAADAAEGAADEDPAQDSIKAPPAPPPRPPWVSPHDGEYDSA